MYIKINDYSEKEPIKTTARQIAIREVWTQLECARDNISSQISWQMNEEELYEDGYHEYGSVTEKQYQAVMDQVEKIIDRLQAKL